MDIAAQIIEYFATATDATDVGEAAPHTSSGNTVTPYVDGRRYFRAIRALLETMGSGPNVADQFFYVAGWWLQFTTGSNGNLETTVDPPFNPNTDKTTTEVAFGLEDDIHPDPGPDMSILLAKRAADGVDVRVLAWVNPTALTETAASESFMAWNISTHNLLSIEHLRQLTVFGTKPLANQAMALSMAHALGAMHLKMVVVHDGKKPWAFIGGVDFQSDRVDEEMHPNAGPDPAPTGWHDMMIVLDGPAIQPIYDLFKNLWNEQRKRITNYLIDGSSLKGTPSGAIDIPDRTLPNTGTGKHHVQVAVTIPQYNFSTVTSSLLFPHNSTAMPFASDGRFEIEVALKKAIGSATEYIYIEDQAFRSQDVMRWIHDRVKANSNVKIILVSGAPDPKDPPVRWPTVEAINNHLLDGLSAAEKARIGFFTRRFVFVHSKITIIDDHWLFVGTANVTRRSLFTDFEVSAATLDEDDELAKETRVNLWGAHFGKTSAQRTVLEPLSQALGVWNSAWGVSQPFTLPTSRIAAESLPLAPQVFDAARYDFVDPDSRHSF